MKLVPSAKADSASLTSDVPALPCRAFMCRRCAAEAGYSHRGRSTSSCYFGRRGLSFGGDSRIIFASARLGQFARANPRGRGPLRLPLRAGPRYMSTRLPMFVSAALCVC